MHTATKTVSILIPLLYRNAPAVGRMVHGGLPTDVRSANFTETAR